MTPIELLEDLQKHDVYLSLNGEKLHVHAAKGAFTPELQAQVLAQKTDLLHLLSSDGDQPLEEQEKQEDAKVERCAQCPEPLVYYSDQGIPYCEKHRREKSLAQCAASPCPPAGDPGSIFPSRCML
ncbi:hypothetical protein KDH_31610 [Dictyobacter sp. S3.2.2.5]|uniref:TubC N-terminal docking domain-containing protein n=1 Tax=Dictyobacter halimunensis TaxID=3026934 RepID=A0ABQ6FV61_9CHLR|nr:hypothetical protein KDH_31610 [Dictyobacter sp. S3.2.2.5]